MEYLIHYYDKNMAFTSQIFVVENTTKEKILLWQKKVYVSSLLSVRTHSVFSALDQYATPLLVGGCPS